MKLRHVTDWENFEAMHDIVDRALAAGAQSAETNEDLAQSEGRQSGGDSRNAQTPEQSS